MSHSTASPNAMPLPDAAISMLHTSASQAYTVLKATTHEDRLLLLCQLTQGKRNVDELEALVGLHQPSLSQQLGVLRDEGLVATRREGKYIYYQLASFEVIRIMQTLSELYCGKVMKKMAER